MESKIIACFYWVPFETVRFRIPCCRKVWATLMTIYLTAGRNIRASLYLSGIHKKSFSSQHFCLVFFLFWKDKWSKLIQFQTISLCWVLQSKYLSEIFFFSFDSFFPSFLPSFLLSFFLSFFLSFLVFFLSFFLFLSWMGRMERKKEERNETFINKVSFHLF